MAYNPTIDGLRAVAVLAVVAYHAGLPVPGGFVGVDIFFVISGYLITRLLHDELQRTGKIQYRAFYVRRVRRIFPALTAVVATTIALSALLDAPARSAVASSAAASLAMFGNFHFQAVTGGYFDASADAMPLLHLWSLGVEEQFYLLWPLVLSLFIRGRQLPLVVLAVLSFALAQYLLSTNPEAAFYQMPARGWELAAGAWLAVRPEPETSPRWIGGAGLLLLLVAISVPYPPSHFPGIGAVPVVAGSMLVIYGSHANVTLTNRILSSKPLTYVGLISYGLYLWHWPLLAIYRTLTLTPSAMSTIGLCVVATGLAALSYRYLETPLRRGHGQPRAMAAGILCCVCVGATTAASLPLVIGVTSRQTIDMSDYRCTVSFDNTIPKYVDCRPNNAQVVLWGDSHAASWLPLAESFGTVANFTMNACAPLQGVEQNRPGNRWHARACSDHNAAAVSYIERGVQTVVITAHLKDQVEEVPYLVATVDEIAQSARLVILVMPTPYLQKSARECIRLQITCHMPRDQYDAYAEPIRRAFATVTDRHANVRVVEVVDYFCTEVECPATRDGEPLYFDDHHITGKAARKFPIPTSLAEP